jgi:hypothetical protein
VVRQTDPLVAAGSREWERKAYEIVKESFAGGRGGGRMELAAAGVSKMLMTN